MQDIRVLGLDLDGTVFDSEKRISPRTMAAMQAAIARGVVVLPATGRPVSGVPKEFLHLEGVRYALTSNGATVTELATGRRVVELTFDADTAGQVYDIVRRFNSALSIFIDGNSYTSADNMDKMVEFSPPALRPYLRDSRIPVQDMHAFLRQHAHGIEKFSILYPDYPTRDAARAAVLAACDVEATSSLGANLELNAPGVNKGRALVALAETLGYRRENVMACGDSDNDLAMIRMAGLGVAMGNAEPEILAAAAAVTDDNDHDGVAKAIERYILGTLVEEPPVPSPAR